MTCEDSRIYLPAYLDDELDVTESLRVQRHLAACATCRQAHGEQLALRSALRDPDLYAPASPGFANRVQSAVRQAAKRESRPLSEFLQFGSFRWAFVALALVLAAVGVWVTSNGLRESRTQVIASSVVTAHIRSLQAGHLVDVPSSDRHTVKPWFQGKLDFSPPVPDLADLGWELIGGRLDYLDGRSAAAVVYQRRKHNINVFLWPNHSTADDTIHQADAQGYQILYWSGADMTYWVVSDLNQSELLEFARALRGH